MEQGIQGINKVVLQYEKIVTLIFEKLNHNKWMCSDMCSLYIAPSYLKRSGLFAFAEDNITYHIVIRCQMIDVNVVICYFKREEIDRCNKSFCECWLAFQQVCIVFY